MCSINHSFMFFEQLEKQIDTSDGEETERKEKKRHQTHIFSARRRDSYDCALLKLDAYFRITVHTGFGY